VLAHSLINKKAVAIRITNKYNDRIAKCGFVVDMVFLSLCEKVGRIRTNCALRKRLFVRETPYEGCASINPGCRAEH